MTQLPDQALETVGQLPPKDQDEIARAMQPLARSASRKKSTPRICLP
jgi:hypothetical protein